MEPDCAMAICTAIHEKLGQRDRIIQRDWTRALAIHNMPHSSTTYDTVQDCVERIRRGERMHVIGSVGTICVDPRTGKVVKGADLVGIERVRLP